MRVRFRSKNVRMRFINLALIAAGSAAIPQECLTDLTVDDWGSHERLIFSKDGKYAYVEKTGQHYTVDYRADGRENEFDALVTFHETVGESHSKFFGSKKLVNKCTDKLLVVAFPENYAWEGFHRARNAVCPSIFRYKGIELDLSTEAGSKDYKIFRLDDFDRPEEFFKVRLALEVSKDIEEATGLVGLVGQLLHPLEGVSKTCNAQMVVVRYVDKSIALSKGFHNTRSGIRRFYAVAKALMESANSLHIQDFVLGEKLDISNIFYILNTGGTASIQLRGLTPYVESGHDAENEDFKRALSVLSKSLSQQHKASPYIESLVQAAERQEHREIKPWTELMFHEDTSQLPAQAALTAETFKSEFEAEHESLIAAFEKSHPGNTRSTCGVPNGVQILGISGPCQVFSDIELKCGGKSFQIARLKEFLKAKALQNVAVRHMELSKYFPAPLELLVECDDSLLVMEDLGNYFDDDLGEVKAGNSVFKPRDVVIVILQMLKAFHSLNLVNLIHVRWNLTQSPPRLVLFDWTSVYLSDESVKDDQFNGDIRYFAEIIISLIPEDASEIERTKFAEFQDAVTNLGVEQFHYDYWIEKFSKSSGTI